MDKEKSRIIKKRITLISILMLVAVVGYIVHAFVFKQLNIFVFQLIFISFLVGYLVLFDFIEPLLLKQFTNITAEQKSAYLKFLGIDMIGTGCLVFYIIFMGRSMSGASTSYEMYVLLIYIVTARIKFKFKNQFLGIKTKGKTVSQEDIQENTNKIEEIMTEEITTEEIMIEEIMTEENK